MHVKIEKKKKMRSMTAHLYLCQAWLSMAQHWRLSMPHKDLSQAGDRPPSHGTYLVITTLISHPTHSKNGFDQPPYESGFILFITHHHGFTHEEWWWSKCLYFDFYNQVWNIFLILILVLPISLWFPIWTISSKDSPLPSSVLWLGWSCTHPH